MGVVEVVFCLMHPGRYWDSEAPNKALHRTYLPSLRCSKYAVELWRYAEGTDGAIV